MPEVTISNSALTVLMDGVVYDNECILLTRMFRLGVGVQLILEANDSLDPLGQRDVILTRFQKRWLCGCTKFLYAIDKIHPPS